MTFISTLLFEKVETLDMANNVRKKNKIGKNKKKSWKNIDIADVEEYLEDERLQERTGGLVAEKPNEQLFVVDKRDDLAEDKPSNDTATLKRKRREPKPLKCHANLVPDPKIKPSRVKHNVPIDKLEKRHKNVVEKVKEGKLTYTQIKAQQQRKSATEGRQERRRSKRKLPTADYDLWTEEGPNNTEDSHFNVITKKRKVNHPKHYLEKPSELPALEVPHPGASYNPTYDDHQKLLRKAHNVEVTKVKEEKKIYNALDAKFTTTDWNSIEKNWLNEMSAGLEDQDEEQETFTPEELDKLSVNPPVHRDSVKPEKQRKKEQSQRKQEKTKLKETEKKERERGIFRLKSIRKEIQQEEKRKKEKAQQKEKKKALTNKATRKLGKMKYEDPCVELKLSGELEGSLRLLKPEGNLFEDRFKSLQKRNMIEPRLRAKKQKHYAPKSFERKSHRNVPDVKVS